MRKKKFPSVVYVLRFDATMFADRIEAKHGDMLIAMRDTLAAAGDGDMSRSDYLAYTTVEDQLVSQYAIRAINPLDCTRTR